MMDKIKLLVAVVLMIAAIVLFYIYSEYSTLIRVIALLVVVSVALFITSKTEVGGSALSYLGATNTEVRKVVWPSRQDTVQTTLVVIVMVIVMALILWGVDSLLGWGVSSLIKRY